MGLRSDGGIGQSVILSLKASLAFVCSLSDSPKLPSICSRQPESRSNLTTPSSHVIRYN